MLFKVLCFWNNRRVKFVSYLFLNPNNEVCLTFSISLISEERSQLYESVFQSTTSFTKVFHHLHTLAMMRLKTSGSKYEKIFRRISSGRSFSDVGSLAITDCLDTRPFFSNMGTMLMLSASDPTQVQKYWSTSKYIISRLQEKYKLRKPVIIRMTRLPWHIEMFRRILIRSAMKYYLQ